MHNTQTIREGTHVGGNAANPGCRNGISEPSKRVLSMEAVMNDIRTILWPDRRDQKCREIGFASEDETQK